MCGKVSAVGGGEELGAGEEAILGVGEERQVAGLGQEAVVVVGELDGAGLIAVEVREPSAAWCRYIGSSRRRGRQG